MRGHVTGLVAIGLWQSQMILTFLHSQPFLRLLVKSVESIVVSQNAHGAIVYMFPVLKL